MNSDELRRSFLSFFQERGHKIIPSSSLVPHKDPTLLLTTAGMVQIKPYFLGLENPPSPRLASCQKCFRTTDIDAVGDNKHLTFFEMLGNFSVGDYFKKEAIYWAWEFVTNYLKLPQERLWVTVYLDDDEAFGHWRDIGFPEERILRFGEEDNFWGPVGNTGPCGPCSEIHYDFGEEFGCGKPECKPNCKCARFSEIWNLVFTQYDQDSSGRRVPLSKPNIDTGMGLERTLAAVQGKASPYETDLFAPLIDLICQLSGRQYGQDATTDRAIRIAAEHSRGIAFLIADGVLPSNEGRGYVLRRILRRASLFGRRLGLEKPFLPQITEAVVHRMSHVYPELKANLGLIQEIVRVEEEKFLATLDTGVVQVEKLSNEASAQGKKELTGEVVFRLYDTYGFPAELTAEIAREKGLSIDWDGFRAEMEKQREKARTAIKVLSYGGDVTFPRDVNTTFVGYETMACRCTVLHLKSGGRSVTTASLGDDVEIILDRTPFYGEMGGQVGDTGEIRGPNGKVVVTNTVRGAFDVVIHRGKLVEGTISLHEEVEAKVDSIRRLDTARNHTATHLLQAALRQVLGNHVYQKGSLVEPDRLRFDFSHVGPVREEQLTEVQRLVNEWIRQDLKVEARLLPYAQAVAEGAIALFEEKYGDEVRMLQIGEPAISKELCGGTHVKSTGEIGIFLLTNEGSIGTGLHRIEAVTGRKAESLIEFRFQSLQAIAKEIGSSVEEVPARIRAFITELEAERRRALCLERELSRKIADELAEKASQVNDVTVVAAKVPPLTMPILREIGDLVKDRLKSVIVILATVYDGRPSFLAMITPDLVARGFHAGEIIKQVAKVTGGGGGGKASMAQAGGKDVAKIDEALKSVPSIVKGQGHPA